MGWAIIDTLSDLVESFLLLSIGFLLMPVEHTHLLHKTCKGAAVRMLRTENYQDLVDTIVLSDA